MNDDLIIVAEQNNETERLFKTQIIDTFRQSGKKIRAYLPLIQYGMNSRSHVALLIHTNIDDEMSLFQQCQQIYLATFFNTQDLDIIFINNELEQKVRKVCCPFYTTPNFNVSTPDFYLYSGDGYHLDDVIRNCYMQARFNGTLTDGYMLCDIDPPINGEVYGLKNKKIDQLIFASKWEGTTLFPVSMWPLPIYVFRALIDNTEFKDMISKSNTELVAWADLYNRKEDVQLLKY